jgi:DNA-directed RNA polymerase omega subunit
MRTKAKTLSRGPELDTEMLVRNTGGMRYDLVLIAAARAREIRRQNKDSDTYATNFPIVTALLEIQEGKINAKEYLAKIKFPQPKSMVDRGAQFK